MKYLSLIYLLFSFSVFADFDEYPNISSYLKGSDINKDKVFVLLNNKRLLSRDYHPTSFIRVRDEYPKLSLIHI